MSEFGLATPSGKLPGTGLGGLTLGGGIGWLVRKHGLTIDHLLAAEVVLADGQVVTASATEHQDLFWGLRGGGGNFGIVTRFTFRLLPVATVYGGLIAHPLSAAHDVLRFYREFIKTAPEELTTVAALMTHPQAGKMVAIAVTYTGPASDAGEALAPLAEFGSPAMAQLGEMPYTAMLNLMKDSAPKGFNRMQRSGFVERFGDGLIDRLVDAYAASRSSHNVVLIEHYGGAMSRVAPDATAFPHRNRDLNLLIDMGWAPGEDPAVGKGWGEALWTTVQPYLNGSVYINFLDDEGEARVKAAYGAANFARLKELKRTYDPGNLFSQNHNVPASK
ncbi:MAG: BBE domain-containing protein [Thermomicrobiales bacterium]|nr:BBE domain-containing protein [Thermomicrobiales bacterium]